MKKFLLGIALLATVFSLVRTQFVLAAAETSDTSVAIETPAGVDSSRNWAGYVSHDGTYTAVSGTWNVPTPKTDSAGSEATWVGIGGVESHDLIQAGTQSIVEDGEITYEAWVEGLPGREHMLPVDISGGDSISVSLTETSPGVWHLSFMNNTNGESYQNDFEYSSSKLSAEWIEELPTGIHIYVPLNDFGTAAFQNARTTKDGADVSLQDSGAKPVRMINRNEEAIATPSLVGDDGSSFSVTRTDGSSETRPALASAMLPTGMALVTVRDSSGRYLGQIYVSPLALRLLLGSGLLST